MTGQPSEQESKNGGANGCVEVAVRVRPMLPFEAGSTQCVEVLSSGNSKELTVVRVGGESGPKFTFDEAFPSRVPQNVVFENRVAPLVASCLEGYNATILAYGQTGSGKTFTMLGPSSSPSAALQDELNEGIIPRAIRSIFDQLDNMRRQHNQQTTNVNVNDASDGHSVKSDSANDDNNGNGNDNDHQHDSHSFEYEVRVQFLEVYGEDIRDLLTPHSPTGKLTIRDVGMDEPEVLGATTQKVESAEEALLCLIRGMFRRVTGSTKMNSSSSRSHAIISVLVEQSTVMDKENQSEDMPEHIQAKRSKFNFVDLAGSERQKRTQAEGQRLKEGIDINKGLLVLGNVISALGDPKKRGKTFVPYRDSKLTRLLKGSLGGNHKTLMIACVSPSSNNMEESLNCLRYANRAKNIQNHAVVNVDPTSRLVSELRGKIQSLATHLLRARCGDISEGAFPTDVLQTLASGADSMDTASHAPSPMRSNGQTSSERGDTSATYLRQAREANRRTEEKLHASNAEKEMYRVQLQAQNNENGPITISSSQDAFLQRAKEYEKEISELKQKLRHISHSDENQSYMSNQRDNDKDSIDDNRPYLPKLPPRTPVRGLNNSSYSDRSESPEMSRLKAQALGSMSNSGHLDAEVEAEEQAVVDLTSRYLSTSVHDDDDQSTAAPDCNDTFMDDELTHALESSVRLQQQMEADLLELSNNIAAKEETIQQLQHSQQKYEEMREFYETKLKEMEDMLTRKEKEREQMNDELKKMDVNHHKTKELAERLRQKDEHIATLKRKQKEVIRLTSLSSRNESEISRLQRDVAEMKQKKVILQKQVAEERKQHAAEVQRLKKESMQKDREVNKWKKTSGRHAFQAERAQQMAKSRLDQMSQLKSKYREAEQRLRMQTLKRGVMQKAGFDPVFVGRRVNKRSAARSSSPSLGQNRNSIDFDSLRDHLDKKVSDVGRKEAIADKLAREWEEHLELETAREKMSQEVARGEDKGESLESLKLQIKYKKERIRQLAGRLGKREPGSTGSNPVSDGEAFIFDKDFQSLVEGCPPLAVARAASKVLFGMIVRERRRVASLARTASALDGKLQEAAATASSKEAAYRALEKEHQDEMAQVVQEQQEQILSLMDMVRGGGVEGTEESEHSLPADENSIVGGHIDAKLLVLANERIAALERQLREVQMGKNSAQRDRENDEEKLKLLRLTQTSRDDLQSKLDYLVPVMTEIKEITESNASESNGQEKSKESEMLTRLNAMARKSLTHVLGKEEVDTKAKSMDSPGSISRPNALESRRRSITLDISDSEDEGEGEVVPEWADDIMSDLAVIAEGKMPTVLQASSTVKETESQLESSNVFDRLTDPNNFTGVQKSKNPSSMSRSANQQHRKLISRQITESLDKVVIPSQRSLSVGAEPGPGKRNGRRGGSVRDLSASNSKDDDEANQRRSVFDRLSSPSNTTGTQKQKFQDKRGRKDRLSDPPSASNPKSRLQKPKRERSFDRNTDLSSDKVVDNPRSPPAIKTSANPRSPPSCSSDLPVDSPSIGRDKKGEDYAQQDVFERLTKTTTQAYAVKQHGNIAQKLLDDILDDSKESEPSTPEHVGTGFSRVDDYTQQNVFERLQKNTTQAYAVKQHVSIADKLLDDILESDKNISHRLDANHSEHGSPSRGGVDVFERLQKTTTESFAGKLHNPRGPHINDNNNSSHHESVTRASPQSPVRKLIADPATRNSKSNVFERLQNTSTEAFEHKKHPPL